MRLLIASQHFWPESFRINDVARALRDQGCEITVLTGQPNYPEGVVYSGYRAASLRREQWKGVDIIRVPLVPRGKSGSLSLGANYLSYLVSATLFGMWALRGRRYDAILVYGTSPILQAIPAIALKWLKGALLVTWVQDLWPESLSATGHVSNNRLLQAVDGVVRWIYRRNDLLLGQSPAFVEAIEPKASAVPVRYFPNPGDMPASEEVAPYPFGPGFHLVFAGNLGKAQSLETIVAAADKLRPLSDIVFHVFGSGSQEKWLRDEIARSELTNVRLHGRVPSHDMPSIFAGADALLVTLGGDRILTQTVPSKVQAYLQAGRPIVAALDGEGARVVAEAGAGLVSPAEDGRALASNIEQIYRASVIERNSFASAGKRYFERHYDPDMLASRLMQLLREAGSHASKPRQKG